MTDALGCCHNVKWTRLPKCTEMPWKAGSAGLINIWFLGVLSKTSRPGKWLSYTRRYIPMYIHDRKWLYFYQKEKHRNVCFQRFNWEDVSIKLIDGNQVAWHGQTSDKPLSEPMVAWFRHLCVTRNMLNNFSPCLKCKLWTHDLSLFPKEIGW